MNLNYLIKFITSQKASNIILGLLVIFTLIICGISQSQKFKTTQISASIKEVKKTDKIKIDAHKILNDEEINEIAEQITVLIKSKDSKNIGSGVIVKVNETIIKIDDNEQSLYRYLLLTNNHVVDESDTFQVKTNDNKIHFAHLEKLIKFKEQDLALLWFISPYKYQKANLGDITKLPDKSSVYAVGFPCPNRPCQDNMVIKSGVLAPQSLLDGKSFVKGRNIGYSAEVIKGMSGGPIVDFYGNVIGVNSFKKHPTILWENDNPRTLIDENGHEIELTQEQKTYIDYFAWGVSIDFYKQLLNNNTNTEITTLSNNQETSTITGVNDSDTKKMVKANDKLNKMFSTSSVKEFSLLVRNSLDLKIIVVALFLLFGEKIYIYCQTKQPLAKGKRQRANSKRKILTVTKL
jgi:hypothetical protein